MSPVPGCGWSAGGGELIITPNYLASKTHLLFSSWLSGRKNCWVWLTPAVRAHKCGTAATHPKFSIYHFDVSLDKRQSECSRKSCKLWVFAKWTLNNWSWWRLNGRSLQCKIYLPRVLYSLQSMDYGAKFDTKFCRKLIIIAIRSVRRIKLIIHTKRHGLIVGWLWYLFFKLFERSFYI